MVGIAGTDVKKLRGHVHGVGPVECVAASATKETVAMDKWV